MDEAKTSTSIASKIIYHTSTALQPHKTVRYELVITIDRTASTPSR